MAIFNRKRLPVIYQSVAAECGLACIAMITAWHGRPIDLHTLRERCQASARGVTLNQLLDMAGLMLLDKRVVQVTPENLHRLQMPAILHWDLSHFVVLKAVRRGHAVLHDPDRGEIRLKLADLSHHLTGIAIELTPGAGFIAKDERVPLRIFDLTGGFSWRFGRLGLMTALALASQVLMVLIPYYFQIVIDDIVPAHDMGLLNWLVLLFTGFILLDWSIKHLRNSLTFHFSAALNDHLSRGLFARLIRLPLPFFENRNFTDVVSRFDSLDEIRSLISEDAVNFIVEGLMFIVIFCVLLAYDMWLVLWMILFMLIYILSRWLADGQYQRANQEQVVREVMERSHMTETVRAMQTIKTFGAERLRLAHWHQHLANATNAGLKINRKKAGFALLRDNLITLESVGSLYLAAQLIVSGDLSLGMMFAFFTYKRLFISSCLTLTETVFKVRMLNVHLDRLADIALAQTEPQTTMQPAFDISQPICGPIRGGPIRVHKVGFTYPGNKVPAFSNLSFQVKPGERIVLVGPSGAGKTSFLKVLLQLFPVQDGEIWIGEGLLTAIPRATWLATIGAVMQNDQLFSSSIRENIAFGAVEIDDQQIIEAAKLACILPDIEALPMQFETKVMDLGAGLSAGQIQRILIARALYRRPQMLVMDEGTANLDQALEAQILSNIRQLGITVIQAAHRPQVIADATQVISL
jgi:ATP-binding cassette, subfamily B, bacterial CvaB/MchF/RaxB